MRSRNYIIPATIFAAGAVIGRIIGLKRLTQAAVATAAFAGIGPKAIVETADKVINGKGSGKRRPVKPSALKRSAPRKRPVSRRKAA